MLITRAVSLLLVFIEAVLTLRLLLPFMRVPRSMEGYVPMLVTVSDWLMAPFQLFLRPFTLDQLSKLPGASELGYERYLDKIDTTVLVAMVGWAIAGAIVLFVLRMLIRPR